MPRQSYKFRIPTLLLLACLQATTMLGQRPTQADVNRERTLLESLQLKMLGKPDKAYELLDGILLKNGDIWYEMSILAALQKQDEAARSAAAAAVQADPGNPWFALQYAGLLEKQGDYPAAIALYESWMAREPGNRFFAEKAALLYMKNEQGREAIRCYDALERIQGIAEETTYKKHTLYRALGLEGEAEQELLRLVRAFPDRPEYRLSLARYYDTRGLENQAVQAYEDLLRMAPGHPEASRYLSERTFRRQKESGGKDLASLFADPAISLDVKLIELIPSIGQLARTGDPALGEKLLGLTGILGKTHAPDAKVLAARGDILYHLGRREEALAAYRASLSLNKSVFSVYEQVAGILYENQDFAGLAAFCSESLELFPNQPLLYHYQGICLLQEGKAEQALSALGEAALMSRKKTVLMADILMATSAALFELKRNQEAGKAMDEALALVQRDPEGLSAAAAWLAQSGGSLEKALGLAETAMQSGGTGAMVPYRYGLVLAKAKRLEESRKALETSLGQGGRNQPVVWELYGDVLYRLGQADAAVEAWRAARAAGSPSSKLQRKIDERKLVE